MADKFGLLPLQVNKSSSKPRTVCQNERRMAVDSYSYYSFKALAATLLHLTLYPSVA